MQQLARDLAIAIRVGWSGLDAMQAPGYHGGSK